MLQRNQVSSQFVCRFHSTQADRNVLTYYSEESVGPSLNGFCKPREGALELNSRERDGTDLKAYEDIMEAPKGNRDQFLDNNGRLLNSVLLIMFRQLLLCRWNALWEV